MDLIETQHATLIAASARLAALAELPLSRDTLYAIEGRVAEVKDALESLRTAV